MGAPRMFSLNESLKALNALRDAAGLQPEEFPLEAFVGMISDEVEALRMRGKSDEEIVSLIRASSTIDMSAAELSENYATPEQRQQHRE